jgi:AhpD family alkylhydroperoxidase
MKELRQARLERLRRITLQRKWAHSKWSRLDSRVYDAAAGLEALTFRDGALARKHKELIALGIGVITDCESCMQWHMEHAVDAGASEKEVVEALEVAIEMGVVPATVHARFALEVLDGLFPGRPSEPAGEIQARGRRRGIRRSARDARLASQGEPAPRSG